MSIKGDTLIQVLLEGEAKGNWQRMMGIVEAKCVAMMGKHTEVSPGDSWCGQKPCLCPTVRA